MTYNHLIVISTYNAKKGEYFHENHVNCVSSAKDDLVIVLGDFNASVDKY